MDGITRKDFLKGSGLALGGLALGGALGDAEGVAAAADDPKDPTQRYTYFHNLDPFVPGTPLEDDEMRITFMGSGFPPPDHSQAEMSLFVEVGPWVVPDPVNNPGFGRATDSVIFDMGAGVYTNYDSMKITPSRMNKVFLNHLHGDHINDVAHLYWFGPAADRKSPLYVFGPSRSGVKSPAWGKNPPKMYDDGTRAFCQHIRDAMRWGTESFSFQTTSYKGYNIPRQEGWVFPDHRGVVSDDPKTDGYALIPIELNWRKYGAKHDDNVAYYNPTTGVKITHFPVIHCRKGSVGYKLEWNGLSMLYSSDTKPETNSVDKGHGVDVFIHEMILPADALTMRTMGITSPPTDPQQKAAYDYAVKAAQQVQDSSHTPIGAYGYMLSQLDPAPRLAVATHFTISDDTIDIAMQSVRNHVPGLKMDPSGEIVDSGAHPAQGTGNITFSTDLMVIRVFPDRILVQQGVVKDYLYQPYPGAQWPNQNPAKYDDHDPNTPYGDVYYQIDMKTSIPQTDPNTHEQHWDASGY